MDLQKLPKDIQQKINNLEYNTEPAKKDLTGQTFTRLTVLGRGPDYISPGKHRASQWWCICDCPEHNIILTRIGNLTSGNTKSCGCLNKEKSKERIIAVGHSLAKDITNQQFGELIAIRPTNQKKNNSILWECICSCGKIHYATCTELVAGRITSCGCKKFISKGIRKIKQILEDANIPYIEEKTYPDLRFPETNGIPRFDFYINDSFLLEYDGEQHFIEKNTTYFKDSLTTRQQHDNYKNQWCIMHNIPLKRIPYTDLDNITLDSIMSDKYLINR